MKKLAFLFIILIGLIVITGCSQTRKNVTHFSTNDSNEIVVEEAGDNGTTTTITTIDNGEKAELKPIEIPTKGEDVKFAVTSMEESVLESNKGYHFIEGTTPSNTDKIVVNGYALNKYKSGSTKWNYIAAIALGTLREGENNYTIRALDTDDNEIASEDFTIVYSGIKAVTLIPTGNSLTFVIMLTIIGSFGFYVIRRQLKY